MPLIYANAACAPPIYQLRCFCGRPVAEEGLRFFQALAKGKTKKDALDQSGLPTCSPFQSPDSKFPSPPAPCCRATLMTSVDNHSGMQAYQFAIAWGEGAPSVGLSQTSVMLEQERQRKDEAKRTTVDAKTITPNRSRDLSNPS